MMESRRVFSWLNWEVSKKKEMSRRKKLEMNSTRKQTSQVNQGSILEQGREIMLCSTFTVLFKFLLIELFIADTSEELLRM